MVAPLPVRGGASVIAGPSSGHAISDALLRLDAWPRRSPLPCSRVRRSLRLDLSPRTLARYRTTGAGPWFYRFGGCVSYREKDLEEWAVGCRIRRGRAAGGREAARHASP